MGKLGEAFEKRYSLADLDRDMDIQVFGQTTATGMKVSQSSAMTITAYLHGVRLLSETVGIVPLMLYERVMRGNNREGREKAKGNWLYFLLHDEPNPEMDAISFKSCMLGHAITWGNAFAEIEWDMETGEVKALWPLNVSRMKVGRDDKTRELIYVYTTPDGIPHRLPAWRIWHLPAFGFDGILGYDTVYLARETLGLALALREHGARFFGNGARPGGILYHPNRLEKKAKEAQVEHWNNSFGGLSNVNRIAVLDEGIKYESIGIPNQNAEYMADKTFSIQEMSRLLNITPHKMYELSHATFTNIEHQDMEFNKYSMSPWYRRWEQLCNRKLILPADRSRNYTEFFEDALLRADTPTRMQAYKERFYMASMSPNDIREKENENPIDDPMADEYYVQRNMIPLRMAGDPQVTGAVTKTEEKSLLISNAVRRVAEREKFNITKALKRGDEAEFKRWVPDFYRDFIEFVKREMRPALGDTAGAVDEFAKEYVNASRQALEGGEYEKLGEKLGNWEEMKAQQI
jgi:HK97 family phage portal protein